MTRTNYRGARRIGVTALAVASVIVLAGCTTDSAGGGTSVADDDYGFLTEAQYDEITTELAAASAIPEVPVPDENVDVAALAGKRVFIFPSASFLEDCDVISKQMVDQVEELGMEATYFQTDGSPASWVQGMQQATSQGYDAIVLLCGADPDLLGPQVEAATAAGITVTAGALYDTEGGKGRIHELLSAQTNSPLTDSYRATALQAVLDNRGEPFHVLQLTADEIPSSPVFAAAAKAVYEEYCPECEITTVNVPLADVATKATPAVQSALVADPDIKVVMPVFGGTGTTYAAAGVTALGRSDVGIYGSYGMPIADLKQMGDGSPLKGVTRHNNLLRMMTTLDQTLRAMAGQEIVDANVYVDPNRLVTPENIAEFLEVSNEGFGDDAIDKYRVLWGLN